MRQSAVKLFTVLKQPNYYQPWDMGYQTNSGGSGCIIEGRRILTNAHVVGDQVYVQVQKTGDTRKYTAQVEHVGHDCEAALLTVEDTEFFRGTVPVRFGGLPERRERVAVYGFPIGGNDLSITEGVVSRIEVLAYTHSQRELLALQTDAAINPGNSGGPVFKDGKLVGIAFQSYSGTGVENTGYVVAMPVLRHFLDEVKRGRPVGVPDLGIYWQKLENDAIRRYYGLKKGQSGVLITKTVYGSSAWGALRAEDVLLSVEGSAVENDGSVLLRKEDRVHFSHLVSQRHIGEAISLRILRRGRALRVKTPLRAFTSLVRGPSYDVRPTYFIHGGLVFMPLTYNFMKVWDWKDVNPRFKAHYTDGLPSKARRELVFINQVLAHDVNVGYHKLRDAFVERINGRPIAGMADVPAAFKRPTGRRHVIELDHHAGWGRPLDYYASFGTRLVVDAEACAKAAPEILARYGVPCDRSPDLLE